MKPKELQRFTVGSKSALGKLNAIIDAINANKPLAGHGIALQESPMGTQINVIGNNTSVGGSGGISGMIEKPKAKTYDIDVSARSGYTVRQLAIKCGSGTCTVAVKKNGTSIAGLSSIAVTSTLQVVSADDAGAFINVGDSLSMTVSSLSSPENLSFSIGTE